MPRKPPKHRIKGLSRHGRKWRWRRTIDGIPVRVSFSAATEADAIAQVLEFEKHPHLFVAKRWERELDLHIKELVYNRDISQTYANTRTRILTLAAKDMGIDHPRHLTPERALKWLENVRTRTNESTRNSYLTHLKKFCEWLVARNKIYINPCADIKRIRCDFTPRDTFLTSSHVRGLIDAAHAKNDPEIVLILLLACECGMRKGEIDAARPSWLDLERGTITIPATEKDKSWGRKGMVGRKKSVTIELVKELREHLSLHPPQSPYLVRPSKPWGKWKYRYDFEKRIRNHLASCGFPDTTIHDLRRSFGSNRVIAGRTIEQVAHWMGIHPDTAWKYYVRLMPTTGEIEHGSAASSAQSKDTPQSPVQRLTSLRRLLDAGLITEEEHAAKKSEILSRI